MSVPRSAWLKGKGRVRVIEFTDDGRAIVITKRTDERIIVARDRLVFTRGR